MSDNSMKCSKEYCDLLKYHTHLYNDDNLCLHHYFQKCKQVRKENCEIYETTKKNLKEIFKKYVKSNRLWHDTFIPDDCEFKEIHL